MEQENQGLSQYDELAIRHNAAYAAAKSIYEAKHPFPAKKEVNRDLVSLITVLALAIVMVAAVIVSSSRTVDEFGGGLIGAIAFVMIEGGIMAYAFFRARRNASRTRLQNTVRWATAGLILTAIVGLGANVDSTLRNKGIQLPNWVNVSIDLLVAISAPTLAFISSDVLAIELMSTDIRRRENEIEHKSEIDSWWEGFNRSWAGQQRQWGVRVDIEQPRQIPSEIDVNLRKNTSINRPSPKLKLAIEWLREHPEHVNTESRKLGEMMGVSHATANKAQHFILSENDR